MDIQGGCYCGAVRYRAQGEPQMKLQCHCRQCQYFTGGHPNVVMGMPNMGFSFTKGQPKEFCKSDLEGARTRVFCEECGTHLLTLSPSLPDGVLIKVGTLDDPSVFGMPNVAIQTADSQSFHHHLENVPSYQRWVIK
jgi:hypothetical protein